MNDLEYVEDQFIKEKNFLKPFIRGITKPETNLNNDLNIIDLDDQEFTTWSRSHGGNKNTHYDSNDFINRDNIKNLKLQWVFESIKDDNLKKKKMETAY